MRQEGLARCSRPFALPSGGARLVTMQLGPGYVRGDRFACAGRVGPAAELTLNAQSAARAMGREEESVASAHWHVGAHATLRLLGEPLVLYPEARHRATTDVELETGATLVYLDVTASSGAFESIGSRLRVFAASHLLIHDAFVLSGNRLRGAVGSAFFLRSGDAAERDAAELAADAAAREAADRYGVRIGIGRPAGGGISARAVGTGAGNVRAALLEVLTCVEASMAAPLARPASSYGPVDVCGSPASGASSSTRFEHAPPASLTSQSTQIDKPSRPIC